MRFLLSLILLAALAAALFGTLGLRPLYKADESRYAEIPREMVASGDWVTPRLNGFKYFEKPPLQYWATAGLYHLLGEKDWVARLWAALAGFACVLMVLVAGNRLFGSPSGDVAAIVLAGSPLFVLCTQITTLDMGLTFFLTAALLAFSLGHMLLFWAFCAGAVLSKGLVGIVLPLAAVALYTLARWDWTLVRRMRPVAGGLVFLAIAAPWFIAVSIQNDEFLRFFFVQEHFQRFTTHMHQRNQPYWYFLPVLVAGMGPWIVPLALAWPRAFGRSADPTFQPKLFLGLWALVVLAFFSLSGSKLPAYILPIVPALALLLGAWIPESDRTRSFAVQGVLMALACMAAAALAPHFTRNYPGYAPWLVGAGVIAAACAILAILLPAGRLVWLAFGGLAATQIGVIGHGTQHERYSVASLIARVQPIPARAPVYTVDGYDHTIPWYLRRTVTMVAYTDELAKAIEWEPQKFIRDIPSFTGIWLAQPQAYAFIPVRELDKLGGAFPMQVLARDARYVLVRKP